MCLERHKQNQSQDQKNRTSGAVLFGINEVLAPSAANAALIQDEQRESIRAIPTPVEDDIFRAV